MKFVDHAMMQLLIVDEICLSCYDTLGVLIMHDVLQNYVTMKVIVITNYGTMTLRHYETTAL